MADSALLTLAEAAGLLRLKVSTLRAWILRRKVPYCKVGRLVRIRRADIEALIAASVVPARAENETETKQQRKVSCNAGQNPRLLPQL
jgi:excisionase family DNA binding protein